MACTPRHCMLAPLLGWVLNIPHSCGWRMLRGLLEQLRLWIYGYGGSEPRKRRGYCSNGKFHTRWTMMPVFANCEMWRPSRSN